MSGAAIVTVLVLVSAAVGFGLGIVLELVRDRRDREAAREAVWREIAERERSRARLSELGQRGRRP